jgi:hypothetical protein
MAVSAPRYRLLAAWSLVALALLGGATLDAGDLRVVPDEVVFERLDDRAELTVERDGRALAPAELATVRIEILASGGSGRDADYGYRFELVVESGEDGNARIVLRPDPDRVEIGLYSLLVVSRSGERARAAVRVPLGTEERSPQVSMPISWQLPESFVLGSRIALPLRPDPGVTYRWTANGAPVPATPAGLELVPEEPGRYVIMLEAERGEQVLWSWVGLAEVRAESPIPWTITAPSVAKLAKPADFRRSSWSLDGQPAGDGELFAHRFDEPGRHTITCHATEPVVADSPIVFRRITWEVEVR